MERKITAKMIRREAGFQADLHVRESEGDSESRTIEGYALKFGVRSVLLHDWWNSYYEILEPGCVTREMLDKQDIKLTMFHDRQLVLARSNKGNGTLSYEVDNVGVKFWAEMPHTVDGDKALELISRGDIAGCSFIYSTDESDSENAVSYERLDEKDDDGDDILLRHVKRIDNVYDFTFTTDPAYEQTECVAREAPDGYTFDRTDMKMVREADVKSDRTALEATETKKREDEAALQAAKKREALKREQVAQLRRAADTLREFINY